MSVAWGVASICFLGAWTALPAAQQIPASSEPTKIRVQSSLVLVDIISQDLKSGLPVRDFKREDFRVFDNQQEVPITTFAAGAHNDTRPVILWLVVICNEGGKSDLEASGGFATKEPLFRPALDYLENQDTVGVAHWCDNGETQLDLLPTEDRDSAIRVLAKTLKPIPFHTGGNSDQVGEETFRKMIRLVIQDAHRRNPQPLPVIVFLHGDYTGQPRRELDELVNDFLETSGIAFGIKDNRSPALHGLGGEQGEILGYMAKHTGGQYFSVSPAGFTKALETILMQLHFRYELGFIPPMIDGKRHDLRVELTKAARKEHKRVRLRFRPEYIPVRETPEWAR
jgi:hypothetical protein